MRVLNDAALKLSLAALPLCLGVTQSAMAQKWTAQTENLATIVMGVDFVNADQGFVAGGNDGVGPVIYYTSDGGRTWLQQVKGMPSATYMDITMGSATRGLGGGMGMFYKWAGASFTTDGRTWRPSADRWLASAYQDVDSVNEDFMVMVGLWAKAVSTGEGVAVSTDGGATFEYYDWGIDTSPRYGSFVNENVGYVSGGQWPSDESVARLGEGDFAYSQHLRLPFASPERAAYEYTGYRGVIAKTTDGGATWEMVYDDLGRFYFNGIHFADENNGWAVAEGEAGAYILHTADGGLTWDEQHFEANGSLMAIRMVNELEGWAGGADISTGMRTLFLHTTNGGQTWEKIDTALKYLVFNIDIVDADHAYAVGYGATGMCGVLKYAP